MGQLKWVSEKGEKVASHKLSENSIILLSNLVICVVISSWSGEIQLKFSTGRIFQFGDFLQDIKPTDSKFSYWKNEFNMCESWVEVNMTEGGIWCNGMQFGRCNVLEEPSSLRIQHYIQEGEHCNHNWIVLLLAT